MKLRLQICLLVLLPGAAGRQLPAQSAHQYMRQGDRHYERSNYKDAEQAYRNAAGKKQNDPVISYNSGNAAYKQGNFTDAQKWFDQAAQSAADPDLQANALHNLGNTFLKQQKYQEAVNAYQRSLRLRPGDPETKVNLQLAKKKWQEQQARDQQPNQQQNPSSGQQNQQQQQQPNPAQANQQTPASPPQNQSPEQAGQQPSEGQMTREQARRLLETAVAPEDQRNARKYRELDPGKHQVKPKKDW